MPTFFCGLLVFLATDVPAEAPASAWAAITWAALPDDVRQGIDQYVSARDWRDRREAGKALVELGEPTAAGMLVVLQTADDQRLRRDALQWLRQHFPDHALLKDYILHDGLSSADFTVRYESLWHVGEQGWDEGREALFVQMRDYQGEAWFRYVAAKSLAELGDERALRTLLEAVRNDRYMPRHFGNLGLQALTGKCLNDFDYEYGENAFVSGGVEPRLLNPDPLETAETLARRYAACRDYVKWLRSHQPELYESLQTRF